MTREDYQDNGEPQCIGYPPFRTKRRTTPPDDDPPQAAMMVVNNGNDADWSDDETDNPLLADDRNFYKVEKWTKDGIKVERLLYAGNNLDKAREIFRTAIQHRPLIRLTVRQRRRVLHRWPEE
jgi:hypothetical protein